MILAGLIAARFTHYTALTLLFGAATFLLFAVRGARSGPAAHEGLLRRLRLSLLGGSIAALATAVLVLAFTAANMAGALSGMVDPDTLRTILFDTDFGRVWAFRLAVATLLVGWSVIRLHAGGAGRPDWAVLLLAGALLTTVALTGHAQTSTGGAGLAHRAADAGHLVAAAVWLGALPPFLHLLTISSARSEEEAIRTGRLLQRFHLVGLCAVTALLATGLVNSWFLVGELGALATTLYGRLLVVKLALFTAMVALAADNRLRLVPRLQAALVEGTPPDVWLGRLRAHIRWEFGLGLAVLFTVALLGALEPAINAVWSA